MFKYNGVKIDINYEYLCNIKVVYEFLILMAMVYKLCWGKMKGGWNGW